jgi:hypothetical protein
LTRERRLTVRLADQEIASIKAFADEKHLIESSCGIEAAALMRGCTRIKARIYAGILNFKFQVFGGEPAIASESAWKDTMELASIV